MKNNKRNIIYEKLKREIIFLTYKPNQILNIKELSKKYRVSSIPIREALILLEVDKLVRLIPNKGYYVSDISLPDVIDIFDFRMYLLEICGKLAIEKITENEIDKLELLLNDLKKEKNLYEFFKLESKFHHLLNCSTKNYFLISTLEYLGNHLERLLFFVKIRNSDSYFSRIPKDFEYIILSLKEKNKEECVRILKEHATEFIEYVKESIYGKSLGLNKKINLEIGKEDKMPHVKIEHNPDRKKLEKMDVFNWQIWEKEPSRYDWTYDTKEICYLLEGKVRVEPEGGKPVEFGAGDLVTFSAGLKCIWDIGQKVKKHYKLG